ncbi:MAG: gliding motility-associated C-terminal domain-containing protein [Bacteroidales bacterium]|nr:gliding motility-associated C-terminal domain-containing protein [Bacteroidales bacterium]
MVLTMLPLHSVGQRFVRVDIDTTACLGDTVRIRFSRGSDAEVQWRDATSRLINREKALIPDGIMCDTYGCSYRSTVEFADFADTTRIRSAEQIDFVRINMEHSWAGDLYINLICPNGQHASLMRSDGRGSGTEYCVQSISPSYLHWIAGSNMPTHSNLGMPRVHYNVTNPCMPTADGNEAGTGWNYCWSENTTHGYTYAAGDALIYRIANIHDNTVDSSDAAAGINFYHPDESFDSLIGCPANGTWTIEVFDTWLGENGYVFEWEMALDTSLHPIECEITELSVTGNRVIKANDTLFYACAPAGATRDTTIAYALHIGNTPCGFHKDSTFSIHYSHRLITQIDTAICDGDTVRVGNLVLTRDTLIQKTVPSLHGCDSVVDIRVKVNPTYSITDSSSFCPDQPIIYGGITYGHSMSIDAMLRSADGCDSMMHIRLQLIDSTFGLRMRMETSDGLGSSTLISGCAPFELQLRDTSEYAAWRRWRLGDSDTVYTDSIFTHVYDSVGEYDLTLVAESLHGCRDSLTLPRAVRVLAYPKADFDWEPQYPGVHNPEVQFRNHSYPSNCRFHWDIQSMSAASGFDTSNAANPHYRWGADNNPAVVGDYDVSLIAYWTQLSSDGLAAMCADTLQQTVSIVNTLLEFPNLVTPDGDGYNDTWVVKNLVDMGFFPMNEVWIFNRWGVQVFHAQNVERQEDFWDPNQTNSPDGTYYYRFSARGNYGIVKRNGTIEVVRGGK